MPHAVALDSSLPTKRVACAPAGVGHGQIMSGAPSEQTKHRLLSALGLDEASSNASPALEATAILPPADDDVPERLGGVRMIRPLGRGGMGQVWFGHHEALDLDVAVKILARDVPDGDLLIHEARAAVRLQHPNVVRIHHAGDDAGRLFVVMEYMPGGDVAQLLRREGRLPWRRAVRLALQAAEGLAEAHRMGLVHRDVKPANFLLDQSGQLKVADFGLVQRIGYSKAPAGIALGTPAYMAPEQGLGHPVGPGADVYSLGVTLYQLLTGSKPFRGDNTSRLLQAHQQQALPDPRQLAPDVPVALVELLAAMTAKDAEKRPADGGAVATLLTRLLAEPATVSSAVTTAVPRPSRRRTFAYAAGIAALTAIAVGGWIAGHRGIAPNAGDPAGTAAALPGASNRVDGWRTPPRAAFLLAQNLPADVEVAVERALRGTGLTIVERQRIDRLAGEQRMTRDGFIDAGSGVALGRLVGGHVALIASAEAGAVQLAAVAVETGERVGSDIASAGNAADKVTALVQAAIAALPVRGYATADKLGDYALDLGSAHGVRIGDLFSFYVGTPDQPGDVVAVGRVVSVTRTTADLVVQGEVPKRRVLAQRQEP